MRHDAEPLTIGLVNNMPAAAMAQTAAQFAALLHAAAAAEPLRLRLFAAAPAPPGAPRHEPLEALWGAHLDGLIVTGAEPQAAAMEAEPFWPSLARLIDWAGAHTISAIWSCLAAHAAAFRLDGLRRQPLGRKLSGVFTCALADPHPLLDGMPAHWPVPHSRYNGLDQGALRQHGYRILAHAPRVGADSIAKPFGRSLFLLLQGHPEYDAASLLGEYRRDVRRFLAGERACCPDPPESYFTAGVLAELARLRAQAERAPHPALLAGFAAVMAAPPEADWHRPAVQLYANWLALLMTQKAAATSQPVGVAS
jgi:homoserine O-succinyltransferase